MQDGYVLTTAALPCMCAWSAPLAMIPTSSCSCACDVVGVAEVAVFARNSQLSTAAKCTQQQVHVYDECELHVAACRHYIAVAAAHSMQPIILHVCARILAGYDAPSQLLSPFLLSLQLAVSHSSAHAIHTCEHDLSGAMCGNLTTSAYSILHWRVLSLLATASGSNSIGAVDVDVWALNYPA